MGSLGEVNKGGGGGPPAFPPLMFGRFIVEREIGRGAHSVVYRVADPDKRDEPLALKVMYPDRARGTKAELFAAVRVEAERLRELDHPLIVPLREAGELNGVPYLCFPFIKGLPLDRALAAGTCSSKEALALIVKVARAVQYAHDKGLIHRDLKPRNIIVAADGEPRVLDFGLSWREGDRPPADIQNIVGTPSYMSPEQARGEEEGLTPATDVYGLGAVIYDVLTGRPPFVADTPWKTMQQVLSAVPVPPRKINTSVLPDMERIALWCLEKNPAKRYPVAGALADDLERVLAGDQPKGPGGFWRRLFK